MQNLARRWVTVAVAGGVTAAVLAACGNNLPDGVDGDLTSDWAALPAPVSFTPEPQSCHDQSYQEVAPMADYRPVACDEPHLVETVEVGTFEEEAADLDAPPARGSGEQRQAYRQCEQAAAEYLGDDFRAGRLWLGVAVPSEAGWEGGARWFRCELLEIESVYGGPVPREGSLAGALGGDGEPDLSLGCYQVTVDDGAVDEMIPTNCDEPHDAEFVGSWRGSGGYPDPSDADAEAAVYQGCREQIAQYVDVPVDSDLVFRTGTIADWVSEEDWQAGDRAFRCYLWLPGAELTESLAGGGVDALPVQTE